MSVFEGVIVNAFFVHFLVTTFFLFLFFADKT